MNPFTLSIRCISDKGGTVYRNVIAEKPRKPIDLVQLQDAVVPL